MESSVESCGDDVGDVLTVELEELVDNLGTTIGTIVFPCYIVFLPVFNNVVFLDLWSTHRNIQNIRIVFQTIRLRTYPRGFVLSLIIQITDIHCCFFVRLHFSVGSDNLCRVSGYPYRVQFPQSSGLSWSGMCSDAPKSATNPLSSGFIEGGAGKDQTSEGK